MLVLAVMARVVLAVLLVVPSAVIPVITVMARVMPVLTMMARVVPVLAVMAGVMLTVPVMMLDTASTFVVVLDDEFRRLEFFLQLCHFLLKLGHLHMALDRESCSWTSSVSEMGITGDC
jgi:hypothetical protein